jgi:hypothetical protein
MTTDDTPPDNGNSARLIRDALLRELLREVDDDGRTATRLELTARALIDKGTGGDVAAIREAYDRIAGKTLPGVAQSDDEPQTVTFGWQDRTS